MQLRCQLKISSWQVWKDFDGLFFLPLCKKPYINDLSLWLLQIKNIVVVLQLLSFCLVYIRSIPFSWCAPACAHVLGENINVGTLYHLSQASPDHSAQCLPPYGSHLNTHDTSNKPEIMQTQNVCLCGQKNTHTCWAVGQNWPYCCVWNTLVGLL